MFTLRGVALAAVVAGWCATAQATDRDKAREAFKSATQHYDLAEYKEALTAFKEAYRNFEDPSLLFNIGQCYRQLGDKEQAVRFYRTYLGKQPDSPRRAEVRDLIDKLERAISEERHARVSPPQGTFSPQGQPPETTPTVPTQPPPTVTPEPTPTPTVTPTSEQLTATAPERKTPIYKKWWLWTAVGAVVVVGVGVGLGVGLSSGSTPTASTNFGTLHPF
jgi:tetratricopeptide (TPR) repeat protein